MRPFCIALLLLLCQRVQAQHFQSALFQRLYESKETISSIYTPGLVGAFSSSIDKRYQFNKQFLLKTKAQLLLGIAGTGHLYELKQVSPGLFDAVRIDSTLYAGNNFCAANFSIDSSIYSFGGYGFWKTNGTLKQYNPFSREWDVIPLLEERASTFCQNPSGVNWKSKKNAIPDLRDFNTAFAPSFFWIDEIERKFYVGAQHVINENLTDTLRTNKSSYNAEVSVLDLNTGKWSVKGSLLKYGWHYTVQMPWGLLIVESPESVYVADFKRNRLLYCQSNLLPFFRKLFKNEAPEVLFFSNGNIYLGSPSVNTLDSIPVSSSDFIFTGEEMYTPILSTTATRFSTRGTFLLVGVVVLLVVVMVVYVIRQKRKQRLVTPTTASLAEVSPEERLGLFSETEREFIRLLVGHSLKGKKTTIEEANKIAGVAQKNEPIRRRVRSELINSINEKWIIITGSRDRLVSSVKSPYDARTREYFIVEKWLKSSLLQQLTAK
jgi:hypothetical protein